MDKNKLITMTQKDIKRYDVIMELINKKINGTDASKQLGLSVRQIKRIKARVLKFKIMGVIHGNRGKVGNCRIDDDIKKRAKKLLHDKLP